MLLPWLCSNCVPMYQQNNGICVVGHMQSVSGALRSKFLQVCSTYTHTHTHTFNAFSICTVGRDGSVDIATKLRTGQSGDRIPVGGEIFCTSTERYRGPPGLIWMGTGSFPGIKLPGRGVDHPPPSSAEVQERVELYFSSCLWAFMLCSGVNFTFTFTSVHPNVRSEWSVECYIGR